MDGTILFLAIAALGLLVLFGFFQAGRRLARVEERLGDLGKLDGFAERIQQISHELDSSQLNAPLQAKLTELAEAEERGRTALLELQQRLVELTRVVDSRLEAVGPAAVDAEGVAQRVRTHLIDRGYERVQILSDLTRLDGRDGRVVFEARRHGAMHKGAVDLRDGAVVDEAVRAAYSAFP